MRTVSILSAVALLQGAYGYVFPAQIAATPAVVFRRTDTRDLVKRQEVCDPVSGLSCRVGEYCMIKNGSVGCCPEGSVCTSIRTCVDHDTYGCTSGGTVDGALCCDASVPYCNAVGNTQFCDVVKQSVVTSATLTSSTTACAYDNATTTATTTATTAITTITTTTTGTGTGTGTPSYPSHPAGNVTTTYVLPTLTPYPSGEKPELNSTVTTLPTTLLVAETSTAYKFPTTNVTSTVPAPSEPAQEGIAVATSVPFNILLGGFVIAFLSTFWG